MNIKEAKEEIKEAMIAYFSKNKFGEYRVPIEKQRPIFLMGPPGVGKTAIMEQVAQELDVGIISYSMTHHTRQSALGLPFISTKEYDGVEYKISEYTMSEIIASVYDMMAETGKREGILFLDEINCVSETLAPSMLQFLQYKIFGKHKVPDGWIVVTAGNPPEYNNSVREFDIVTWDRLKRIDVEPDFDVWKEFAYKSGVHASILTYLDIRKNNFYKIESSVDGKTFVTARGWCDLSTMIQIYEEKGLKVTERLIGQYLQNKKIAKDFAVYYDLFNKYKSDYQIDRILNGTEGSEVLERAKKSKFDERLALLGLILDGVTGHLREVCTYENVHRRMLEVLKSARLEFIKPGADCVSVINNKIDGQRKNLRNGRKAGSMSSDEQYEINMLIEELDNYVTILVKKQPKDAKEGFATLKEEFDNGTKKLQTLSDEAGKKLSNAFAFCEKAFSEGQEILIFVTELTMNYHSAHFINRFGCKEYFAHNKELLFYERQKEIIAEIDDFKLDE